MTRSWMWAAKHLGFELAVAAPAAYQPPAGVSRSARRAERHRHRRPRRRGRGAAGRSTPTSGSRWARKDQTEKEAAFGPYQVNDGLLAARRRGPHRPPLPARLPRQGDHRRGARTPRLHDLPAGREPPPRPEGGDGAAGASLVAEFGRIPAEHGPLPLTSPR